MGKRQAKVLELVKEFELLVEDMQGMTQKYGIKVYKDFEEKFYARTNLFLHHQEMPVNFEVVGKSLMEVRSQAELYLTSQWAMPTKEHEEWKNT